MSFIPEDQRDTPTEDSPQPFSDKNPKDKEKSSGSIIRSIVLLVIIFCGLFMLKPYLTGEREIAGFNFQDFNSANQGSGGNAEKKNAELILPKVRDRELKKFLADFKKGFEEIHSPEAIAVMQPKVKIARFGKDRKSLLIELAYSEVAEVKRAPNESGVEPESTLQAGAKRNIDIIFDMDDYGRLVTKEFAGEIKLYPELPEK